MKTCVQRQDKNAKLVSNDSELKHTLAIISHLPPLSPSVTKGIVCLVEYQSVCRRPAQMPHLPLFEGYWREIEFQPFSLASPEAGKTYLHPGHFP